MSACPRCGLSLDGPASHCPKCGLPLWEAREREAAAHADSLAGRIRRTWLGVRENPRRTLAWFVLSLGVLIPTLILQYGVHTLIVAPEIGGHGMLDGPYYPFMMRWVFLVPLAWLLLTFPSVIVALSIADRICSGFERRLWRTLDKHPLHEAWRVNWVAWVSGFAVWWATIGLAAMHAVWSVVLSAVLFAVLMLWVFFSDAV